MGYKSQYLKARGSAGVKGLIIQAIVGLSGNDKGCGRGRARRLQ